MPKFVHLRSTSGKGATTIAYSLDVEQQVCYFALARCNPMDNFCRRTGRVKSAGRLNSPNWVQEFKYEDLKQLRKHFETFHPDYQPIPVGLNDTSLGRSAVQAKPDLTEWWNGCSC